MADFYFRVNDASMSGDRICMGDVVLIRETADISPHDISAVVINADPTQLTLRRVEKENEMFKLIPSNPCMAPELRSDLFVVGRVVRLCI